jgi:hypothetical protein
MEPNELHGGTQNGEWRSVCGGTCSLDSDDEEVTVVRITGNGDSEYG